MPVSHQKRTELLSAAEDAVIEAKRWNALCTRASDQYRPGNDGLSPDQRVAIAVTRARNLLAAIGDE